MDRAVAAFAAEFESADILVVGANDGIARDPLWPYLLTRPWTAHLLEPVPDVFEKLVANTQRLSNVRPLNIAITDTDGDLPFYTVRPPGPGETIWPWYDALGSFNRDVVASHDEFIPDIDTRIVETTVKAMRGPTFLASHGITSVDLLQVDTEGHDLAVLRQFDLSALAPAVVVYEHWHLDEDDRRSAEALLHAAGYETSSHGLDTVGIHQDRRNADGPLSRFWRSTSA